MKLKDKAVRITGAGSGLGRGRALVFTREGAKIGVNDLRPEAAQNVVTELERAGGRAVRLVAERRYVPALELKNAEGAARYEARWRPILGSPERSARGALAASMPAACRALTRAPGATPQRPAAVVVNAFVEAAVDRLVERRNE